MDGLACTAAAAKTQNRSQMQSQGTFLKIFMGIYPLPPNFFLFPPPLMQYKEILLNALPSIDFLYLLIWIV